MNEHGPRKIPLGEHGCNFLHVSTNGSLAGVITDLLDSTSIRGEVKVVAGHSVIEAHTLVPSVFHRGRALRVSSGDRRGRLRHDVVSTQGDSDRATAQEKGLSMMIELSVCPRQVKEQRLQSHEGLAPNSLAGALSIPRSDFTAFEHSLEDWRTWSGYLAQVQRKLSFPADDLLPLRMSFSATESFSKFF